MRTFLTHASRYSKLMGEDETKERAPQAPAGYTTNREYYRVVYPARERPEIVTAGGKGHVIDASERGIRFRFEGPFDGPKVGDRATGVVRFADEDDVSVEGIVVRSEGPEIALLLSAPGIPFRIMLQEQQRLRERYLPLN